jgi:hypothetical protein
MGVIEYTQYNVIQLKKEAVVIIHLFLTERDIIQDR